MPNRHRDFSVILLEYQSLLRLDKKKKLSGLFQEGNILRILEKKAVMRGCTRFSRSFTENTRDLVHYVGDVTVRVVVFHRYALNDITRSMSPFVLKKNSPDELTLNFSLSSLFQTKTKSCRAFIIPYNPLINTNCVFKHKFLFPCNNFNFTIKLTYFIQIPRD